jgi:lipooligosaccharide transport system permease protein
MVPLFLFSGTFFPISQLPGWLQPVAYVTPLWHGVALCRALALGTADPAGAAVHAGYLLVLALAGCAAAQVTYRKRLHE